MMALSNKLYRLKFINRYSNVERIRNESVAEHSFFVATIVLELYEDYDFNLEIALAMAISHDYPEIYIDDISHEVKESFPEVAIALKNAELESIKYFSKYIQKTIKKYEKKECIESKIVKFADIIQVSQYCSSEIKLGNSGYIKSVYMQSIKLKINQEKILKKYRR